MGSESLPSAPVCSNSIGWCIFINKEVNELLQISLSKDYPVLWGYRQTITIHCRLLLLPRKMYSPVYLWSCSLWVLLWYLQTARPKSQPPPSNRPRPAVHNVIRGDEVDSCHSPGGGTGSPSAIYSTISKKSPHKHFHITSYVVLCHY